MLIQFNYPQPLIIVCVGNCLDAGRFARSRITEKQAVIGPPPLHKSFRILYQLLFRDFVAHQIIQMYMGDIQYGHNVYPRIVMQDAERLMQAEFPHTIFPVKFRQGGFHFLRGMVLRKAHCQIANPFADTGIIYLAFLFAAIIMKHQFELPDAQFIHHPAEIIVI